MAIYNRRARFTQDQWAAHFQRRNSVANILYSIIRFLVIIVENLYCIPSYLVISWLVLLPINRLRSDLYSRLENYLYNSLLFIVSSWSLAAGLTVVESGDEFKHLIEESEEQTRCDESSSDKGPGGGRKLVANSTDFKRYLDSNGRVVVNGYASNGKSPPGPLQVNGHHSNINTRASSKLKSNGFATNGVANINGHHHAFDGDYPSAAGEPTTAIKKRENGLENDITSKSNADSNNNHNECKRGAAAKQNGDGHHLSNSAINTIVTKETSLASRIINEQQSSLKTVQAKPRILLLCNHISTADVPLMMQSFSTLTNQSVLWVLDAQFKMTNFGVVCGSHGDFFVDKNSYADGALREHVLKYPDRNLLVLFPEGGFLRKRIDGSNRFATRNGLPHTKNVTHPRFGAFKDLTDPSVGITHIVDATLIYDDIKNPISILDIAFGNKKEPAILHFKVYNRSEITPSEEWLRNIWLEKDKLLTKYYENKASVLKQFAGTFRVASIDWFKVLSVHLFYLLVCYMALFRLFNATSVTMLKARELYYSNI